MMQKNKSGAFTTKMLVYMALLVALNLVFTRLLAFNLGPFRVALGPVATIMAGLWLGPIPGAICGFAADTLGCFLNGYSVNPFITVSAMLWGIIPGIARLQFPKWEKKGKITALCLSILACGILGSLLLNTTGLVLINGYSFYAIFPGRLLQMAVMVPLYCVLCSLLYFSPLTGMVSREMA